MVTIIGDRVAQLLKNHGVTPISVQLNVNLADNSTREIIDAYTFPGLVGTQTSRIKALHLPNLTSPLIIGMDLIDKLGLVSINVSKHVSSPNSLVNPSSITANAVTPLTNDEERRLQEFLDIELPKFKELPGRTTLVEHRLRLKPGTIPIKQRFYPRNPAMQAIIDEEVNKMLEEDIIEPSSSPWSSPIVLIKKSSGKMRFCIDLRRVNQVTEKDAYPLPQIGAILDKLRDAQYITTIDLKNGYWQIPLEAESRPITAFSISGRGLYHFKVMPFGHHSAPATFQRLLDTIVGPELEPHAFAYLDDLVIVSKTFDEHLKLLQEVFSRLRTAGLVLNVDKCTFCKKELKYLGHVINDAGIQTDPEKVQAIAEFPTPKTVKQVRSFLGLASWYRRFVKDFARISAPLTKLLRKEAKWEWSKNQESAFQALKGRLTSTPVLACPDFEKEFILQVDASNLGLGASLTQRVDGREKVIAYASRLLSNTEQKFTVTEKECLALVWAVLKFRPYLEGYKFTAITDHQALKWLMNLEKPSGRLARWILQLQQYEFTIQYRKGSLNRVADALSRNVQNQEPEEGKEEPEQISILTTTTTTNPKIDWHKKMIDKVTKDPNKYVDYSIQNSNLLRRILKGSGPDPTTEWKHCVPEDLKMKVLEECHDLPTAGHLGILKTTNRVGARYFWPGWRRDTKRYVQNCKTCQLHKVEQRQPVGKMYFRRPRGPWYTVTSDVIGPLPRSRKGNRFIVVFQDTFSKWVEMAPLKTAGARQISQKFTELILRFGSPEVVLTDNGTQYVSKIFKKLTNDWKITHQCTALYSPQSNPTERANRVIKTMIAQYVDGDHRNWDEHLDEFRFALNSSVHESTRYTPAMLNFGRELRTPKALHGELLQPTEEEPADSDEAPEFRIQQFVTLLERCRENLKKAFDRQATYYNLRRRDNTFTVGQSVLVRGHTLSKAVDYVSGKLAPKFKGPYKIKSKEGVNIVRLVDDKGRDMGRSHVKDIKPFNH